MCAYLSILKQVESNKLVEADNNDLRVEVSASWRSFFECISHARIKSYSREVARPGRWAPARPGWSSLSSSYLANMGIHAFVRMVPTLDRCDLAKCDVGCIWLRVKRHMKLSLLMLSRVLNCQLRNSFCYAVLTIGQCILIWVRWKYHTFIRRWAWHRHRHRIRIRRRHHIDLHLHLHFPDTQVELRHRHCQKMVRRITLSLCSDSLPRIILKKTLLRSTGA